jgi:hypothetical protein
MKTDTKQTENLAENGNKSKPLLCDVFSVGDTVNYCNGLIFKIAKINKEAETCYDEKGMWYALVNCINIT